jgi:hypothetical protein
MGAVPSTNSAPSSTTIGMADADAQGCWLAPSGRSKSVRSPSWTNWMTLAMNHVVEI